MLISASQSILIFSTFLVNVDVTTLNGTTLQGELQHLNGEAATIETPDGVQNIATDDLLRIDLSESTASETAEPLQVILRDASAIPATSIDGSANEIKLKSTVPGDASIRRSAVRALRLQEVNDEWTPAWNAFLNRNNQEDLLIVVKRDGSGLDFLSGVISTISDAEVIFLLDGDEIPVPRERVFGVVFPADSEGDTLLSGDIAVQFHGTHTLKFASVEFADSTLRGETSWGQQVQLSVEAIQSIDFSSGRLHYLSDLDPITERYFGLDPPGKEWGNLFSSDRDSRTGLSSQWRMSRDQFPNNGRPQLSLRGTTYAKGLCIFPKALIEYALDGRYTKLTAMVGVDDDVAFNQRKGQPPTAVSLAIEADGKEVFRELIEATSEPIPLTVDVTDVSTLSLSVDFGDGSSTCDFLDLADARLIVDTSKE